MARDWNKMVSVLQNVKATMAWRKHQLLADFDENESPVPDKFRRRASLSSLNTICMSLRKRVPLKQVELNFHETPTWESLEARQKSQTLQSLRRTARNALGAVSQVLAFVVGQGWSLVFAPTSVPGFLGCAQKAKFRRAYPTHTVMVVS